MNSLRTSLTLRAAQTNGHAYNMDEVEWNWTENSCWTAQIAMLLMVTRHKWMPVMQQLPLEGLPYAFQSILPLFQSNEVTFNSKLVQHLREILIDSCRVVWKPKGGYGDVGGDITRMHPEEGTHTYQGEQLVNESWWVVFGWPDVLVLLAGSQ